MKHSILYIEDDPAIACGVMGYLQNQGFLVETVSTVAEAKGRLNRQRPSLALIDWYLPDGSGDRLCLWIRERWEGLPVIFLTVKGDSRDMVQGFQNGADDYVTKPFDLEVLHSRIRALLKRTGNAGRERLCCGSVFLDRDSLRVWLGGEEIQVSAMEFRLLQMLMEHKNHTVTRQILLDAVWDVNGSYVNDNTLTVTMKRLREKLGEQGRIRTVRSFGYRMEEPDHGE